MKRLAFLGGAAGLGLVAILGFHHHSQAADHLDSPALSGIPNVQAGNPLADINDVYVWMTTDAAKVNLAMTFSPAEDGTHHLGPAVQYALHVTSHPDMGSGHGFGLPGVESKVICTFADDTHGKCWVVGASNKVVDYVEGDLSGPNGRVSASGKFRVFAGLRSDPFFFNLAGFLKAVGQVNAALNAGLATTEDAAGCPNTFTAAAGLRGLISTQSTTAVGPCPANQVDCFKNFNTLAIVVQVDKDELLQGTDKLLSVWGSTHTTP